MLRRIPLVVLVSVPLAAAAAPVPPEDDAAKFRRIYGEKVDPDKDCTFEMKGNYVRFQIPAKTNQYVACNEWLDHAPRIWRQVDGDFTATVRVTFPIRADVEEKKLSEPLTTAGLLACDDDGSHVRVVRHEELVNGRCRESFSRFLQDPGPPWVGTGYGVSGGLKGEPSAAFVRLIRTGQKVSSAYSRDGGKWVELKVDKVEWKASVKVGIIAKNGYKAPFTVTFDQYTLTQPKK